MKAVEEYIKEHTRNCSNEHVEVKCKSKEKVIFSYEPWLTPDQARRAVEIAREEIYEWLRVNLCNYFDSPRRFEMYLDNLKQAMKDDIRK